MGVCNCSLFCCALLYVHSSIAILLMGKRELVALLNLSSWCFMMVEWLFLAVQWDCLRFVIVVFPDHTHLLFFTCALCQFLCHRFQIWSKMVTCLFLAAFCVAIATVKVKLIPDLQLGYCCNKSVRRYLLTTTIIFIPQRDFK